MTQFHPTEHPPHLPAVDDRFDTIVASALAEFAALGYAGVTMDDIARRAHISTSELHDAFATKDDLFREVVRTTLIDAQRALGPADAAPRDAPTADALRALADRYWRTMELPPLAVLLRLTIAEIPRFPELAVFHAATTLERFLHEIEQVIERGIRRGEVAPLEVRAAARTVLATLAAHAHWFAHPEVYAGLVGSDRERAATDTVDSLLRVLGLTPEAAA